jgi:hypothetical protein
MAAEQLQLDGPETAREGRMSAGNDRIRKLLGKIDTAWIEFQAAYTGLRDEQLLVPGVTGKWSVRDLIAHVTWWEEEAIKHLPTILDGGRPPRYSVTYGGIDAFNALMTERKAGLSLVEIRSQFEETHRRLVGYLLSVPPEHRSIPMATTRSTPPMSGDGGRRRGQGREPEVCHNATALTYLFSCHPERSEGSSEEARGPTKHAWLCRSCRSADRLREVSHASLWTCFASL